MSPRRAGQGDPIQPDDWPAEGDVRDWLSWCNDMHQRNGCPSLSRLAAAMSLKSRNEVGEMLRGLRLPADQAQARLLAVGLGAIGKEVEQGLRRFRAARTEWDSRKRDQATQRPHWSNRLGYLAQVRRIAPPELHDRQAELAELASFCMAEDEGPYVYWRAGPWAGKSALLSRFVLDAPEQLHGRVQVVAFFITARLAAQDTRDAFITVVGEQLCALTGQQPPTVLDESTREAWLLDLLTQAATTCKARGTRLVLIVDGLDEDRGVTTGPHAHSIAGLLPADPPAGMRIIVAGRPNPPIPDDVPDWHPLRDPGIARILDPSRHAHDLQRLGQSELKRLLQGSPVEQDLLGLLTAARGGLTGPDLRELTGANLVAVEEALHTVAGRTFTRLLTEWTSESPGDVYLLGHEELQHAAEHYLGEQRLTEYRDRLHTWADAYRTWHDRRPPWPPNTPEYLLRGYPRILIDTADIHRLVALAVDPARHDRMLDVTGGDAAALTEIAAAHTLIAAQPRPDLGVALGLTWHRDRLADRNSQIPDDLPAVWVTMGQPIRAEALVRSITDQNQRPRFVAELARALASGGYHDQAEQVAHTITDPDRHTRVLSDLAETAATAGDYERAERLARTITDPDQQAQALTGMARAIAAGDRDRAGQLITDAQQLVRANPNRDGQAWALANLAGAAAAAGDYDRGEQLVADVTDPEQPAWALAEVARAAAAGDHNGAERLARTITDPYWQSHVLARLSCAIAATGDHDRAGELITEAERTVRAITDTYWQARALTELAAAAAASNDPDRAAQLDTEAEQLGSTIVGYRRGEALTNLARTAAAAGDHDRAERLARTITDRLEQTHMLTELAGAAAAVGDYDRAERLAYTITNPYGRVEALTAAVAGGHDQDWARKLITEAARLVRALTDAHERARALTELAGAAAAAGAYEWPSQLAVEAEQVARSLIDPDHRDPPLTDLARALADVGDYDRGEQVARTIPDTYWQVRALAGVAEGAAAGGDKSRAARLITEAEQIAAPLTDWHRQSMTRADLARAAAGAGDHDRAERFALAVSDPDRQAQALTEVAAAIAAAGDYDRAERLVWAITDSGWRGEALAALAQVIAPAGDPDRAERLAAAIRYQPYWRAQALTGPAHAAAAGDQHRAAKLIAEAEQLTRTLTHPDLQARALARLAVAVSAAGDTDRAGQLVTEAEQLTRTITRPRERAQVLTELVQSVAATGEHSRATRLITEAEQAARTITDTYWQARALTDLAQAVIHIAPETARSLSVAVLAVGRWSIPLTVAGRLDPQGLAEFVDAHILSPSTSGPACRDR